MIHERKSGKVVILSIERTLKGDCEAALKERLDALVSHGNPDILIDLKACAYLDSAEIGRLIRCHLSVRKAGGRVRLCNLSPRILNLMKMTRLDTVMDLFGTEEQALSALDGEFRTDSAVGGPDGPEHEA
jgi:anti-sigma B factor antagonist